VFAGKKLTGAAWPSGTYTGLVTLTRVNEGKELSREITRTVTVR
jgi:hypothetical protein